MDLVAGAVGSIIGKLGELLQAEYKLQKGLPKQIESLKNELESAQTALITVGQVPPEQLNPQVRLWAREVREASYDMEDILDTFLVNVVEVGAPAESKDDYGLRKHLQKKMGNLFKKSKARHTVAGAIEDMKKRLQEVADRRDRYSVPVSVPAPTMKLDPRLVDMHKEVGQLIGIDEARADLIAMLGLSSISYGDADVSGSSSSSSSNRTKIVSIVGSGGLGKTTLAKAVYDELEPRFDCGAFVSVGRKPDLVQVFTNIFFLLDRKEYEAIHEEKTLSLLIGELKKFLRNKRYFIVIDDVWEIESWKTIKAALDQESSGSRVITTTRNRDVAIEEVYELQSLSGDNSRKLFYARLFGGESKVPTNHPGEVSEKILDKCGGVPLAIITMASLLVGKSREDWFEVCNSPGFYRSGGKDNKQVDDTVWILSLSYYDLPSHLKTCLLYLSVYPEDYLIKKDCLIRKWVAEGFVEKKTGISLFEQGEEYFHHLINRSMVDAVKSEERSIVYGCRVHDMVLDLIRDLSNEENFITVSSKDDGSASSRNSKVRRLVHHNRIMKQTKNVDMPEVRTLVAYRCHVDIRVFHLGFKLLRVLDLDRCTSSSSYNFGWCSLDHLGNLLHLRYLGLRNLWIEELPEEIGALRLLQTLDLEGTNIWQLPSSVWLLTQLICLRCDSSTSVSDGFPGKVTSLEELHIGPPETTNNGDESMSIRQFFKELGNLKELRVLRLLPCNGGLDPSMQSDLVQSLSNLCELQHLELMGNFRMTMDKSATWVWDTAVLPRRLRHLGIKSIWFPRLPSCISPAHLSNLSHLDLHVDRMDDAGLRTLGRLPELRYLNLPARYCWLRTSRKATVANIIMGAGGDDGFFRKLRYCRLDGWMVWLVLNDDSTSVSFSICNGEGVVAFASSSKPNDECSSSRSVAPAVAVMPNLLELQFCVPVGAIYKDGNPSCGSCANLGFQYLLSLHKVKVVLNCEDAFSDDVEKVEAELWQAAELHPNRPILEVELYYEEMMAPPAYQDDEEEHNVTLLESIGSHWKATAK